VVSLEFVRKITQDDFVIITNRLRADYSLIFRKSDEPSTLESFRIPTRVRDVRATLLKNGTLVVRGDAATPEYKHVVETISDILDHESV
jgi:hypothetical protein